MYRRRATPPRDASLTARQTGLMIGAMERDIEHRGINLRRLAHEVDETRRRMVVGGVFYVLGWLLVCLFTPAISVYPWASLTIAVIFVSLAVARLALRPPVSQDPRVLTHWLDLQWLIIQVSAAVWGAVVLWTLISPVLANARMALLVGAAGFATAIAHTYSMRFWPSLLAVVLIYAPATALMWMPGHDRAVAFSLTVYLAYVITSLIRSHRDFHDRLDFQETLRQQRDAFERMSRTDDLTLLANRRVFVAELERVRAEATNHTRPVSLLVIDLDHFKQINDQHGHAIGDTCLSGFAEQLRLVFAGQGELPARLGGEEFAVLLPGHTEPEAATRAEAFRIGLAAVAVVPEQPTLRIHVSIGVAEFDAKRHLSSDTFLIDADRALYRAKNEGRNRVCQASGNRL
ncbi:GGDEF domain-containing protein [Ahniella affigens]|nr:GGDEF domain-containing protein [Ahniella affigens]